MSDAATAASPGARHGERMDRAGILASTLCAMHCLVAAALAAAAPALRFVERPELEWAFVLAALALAAVALESGRRRHGAWAPLLLALSGALVLVMSRLVEMPSERLESAASVAGAALLVAGHAANIRLLRRHDACCACAPPTNDAAAA